MAMARKKKHPPSSGTYQHIYGRIRKVLEEARAKAYRTVNVAMVQAYWNIGRLIVMEEQKGRKRAGYGEYLLTQVSARLTTDFGRGFDERNLRYMRDFYLTFPIWNAVRSELSWTHIRLLLRLENASAREFYEDETVSNRWSTRQLERQINSFYYERILSNQTRKTGKKEKKQPHRLVDPQDLVKDPYILEFLNLKDRPSQHERDLESLLISKLQDFLLELGKGFSLVSRQKRISIDQDHFYVDLVFYNYILRCFVLIDLKVGKLTHQDIGQMDFYVRYFEEEVKMPEDRPTIGLILCSEKNEALVKYSILKGSRQLFASKYKLYLPTVKELKKELERERRYLETRLVKKNG